jgi:hypothetical protein
LARRSRAKRNLGFYWDFILWQAPNYWTFDYFPYSAAKRSRRERFAANLILAPIFLETLTQSAFQEKSARFSQKSSI